MRILGKTYLKKFFNKRFFYFTISAIIISLLAWMLLFYAHLPRQAGLSFRYDLTSIAFILFIISLLALRLKKKQGNIIFTAVFVLLSVLPLSGLWASGQTEPYTLFGLIPISDAGIFYKGALRFLRGLDFTGIATFRPIAPALFSILLRITSGNIQEVLALQAIITAFAAVAAILTVRDMWGVIPAALFSVLVYFFMRPFIGTMLTESFGFTFGVLGFSQLLHWSRTKENAQLFTGVFFLAVGLNVRAGAYFILPAFIVLILFLRKMLPKHALAIAFAALLASWLTNALISVIYSGKLVGFSSNVFNNLYQLVTNSSSWRDLATDMPGADTGDTLSMLKVILNAFLQKPAELFKALGSAYHTFFALGRDGAFGFLEGERVHYSRPSLVIASAGLFLLSGLGFIYAGIRSIKHRDLSMQFIVSCSVGILLSAPILFAGDYSGMRFFAATITFQCILAALGLHWLLVLAGKHIPILKPAPVAVPSVYGLGLITLLTLAIVLLLPINALGNHTVQPAPLACTPPLTPVEIEIHQGAFINIIEDTSSTQNYLPDITGSKARDSSHGLSKNFSSEFKTLNPPFTLLNGINHFNDKMVFLVVLPEEFRVSGHTKRVCALPGGFSRLDANGWLFSELAANRVLTPLE